MSKTNKCMYIYGLLVIILTGYSRDVNGQSNFFASSIFNNKVAFNPSQAGIETNWKVDAVFKSPIDNSQPGLTKEYHLSADGPISESAGVGMNLQQVNTGVLTQTLFHFNYAYGMKLKEHLRLRMGFSAGFKTNRVNTNAFLTGLLVGDPGDPSLAAFNTAPPSFYSCFGLSLYSDNIELQLAAPNLTAKLQSQSLQTLDYVMMQAALTYKMAMGGGHLLGPSSYLKLYAGATQYKQTGTNITGGLQLGAYEFLSFNALYSTSGAITAGVGILVEKNVKIDFNYTIGGLYSKTIYGGAGLSEVHLSYAFNKNKKS